MVNFKQETLEAIKWLAANVVALKAMLADFGRVRKKIDGFNVTGAAKWSNVQDSMSLAIGGGETLGRPARSTMVLVRITGNASGGGKYNGKLLSVPATVPVATGNLTDAEIGADGADVLVFNAGESGKSTHDLTSGTAVTKVLPGVLIGYTAAGMATVAITGFDWEDCTTS